MPLTRHYPNDCNKHKLIDQKYTWYRKVIWGWWKGMQNIDSWKKIKEVKKGSQNCYSSKFLYR